jgi:MFS family permease
MMEEKGNGKDKIMTLIGAILIRLTNGIVLIWGSTNLYFLSYLYYEGEKVSNSTNSILLLASTVPIAVLTLMATKMANKFGYEFVVRMCAVVFMVSPMMINYVKGIVGFVVFYMVLPGAAFAISTIPLLNILVTQFPKYRTRVNSLLIIFLGVSTFVTNLIFSILVNPHNKKSELINGF